MSEPIVTSGALLVKIGIMALIAGIGGALDRHMMGQDKGLKDTVVIALTYAISGLICGLIAKTFTSNEYFILGITGASGFLGTKTMRAILTNFVKDKINIKY